MTDYAFDLKLDVALRVKADTFEDAVRLLKEKLDCAEANFGSWPNGDPIVAEATLNGSVIKNMLFEVDGEEPTVCPECGALEGDPEWGTVGDGFDGYCPSCADKRDHLCD